MARSAAFGSEERVSMLGVDHVVSWSRAWLEAEVGEGSIEVNTSGGEVWSGKMHSSWKDGEWSDLVGRVADLKSAYKQLAVHPSSRSFSVVAVFDPEARKTRLYRALSLMFGETAAVYSFLRVSRALAAIAVKTFNLLVVEFFDDFTQVEGKALEASAWETSEGILDLNSIKLLG